MISLSDDNQADITEAFNSTSRYLDDLLNIDNPYFEGMVNQIYPPELQLNKANTSDTEAPVLDLHLSISYCFVSCKIYDFDIVNFPFFGWRCSTSSLLWSDYFSTYYVSPLQGSGDILFFPLRLCVCGSVGLWVCVSVCLSVTKSCPLYNLITVTDILTKLHTFVKHIETTCHAQEP